MKGRYSTGEEDESPATIGFTVDAIQGPALACYPRRHITGANNSVAFQLMAEEEKQQSRLALCELTARVLRGGLDVLGIEVTEVM